MLLSSAFLIDLKINHNKRDCSQIPCFKNPKQKIALGEREREGRTVAMEGDGREEKKRCRSGQCT